MKIAFRLNGRAVSADAAPDALLGPWLAQTFGTAGGEIACDQGVCGACTVLVDDQPTGGCHRFAWSVEGAHVETIDGIGTPDQPHPLQQALIAHGGLQCGTCSPGMVLAAVALLRQSPKPTRAEVVEALAGNLCRCTGYRPIIDAVLSL